MEWDGLLDGLFDGLFGGSSSGSGISGAWQYSLGAYASQLRGPVGYYAGLLMTSGLNLDDPSGLGYAGAQVEAEYAASHATTFDISSVGIDAPDTDLFSGRTKDTEPGQVPLPTTTDPPSDPAEGRTLEHLDRGAQEQWQNTAENVQEVFVRGNRLGSPGDDIPKVSSGMFDASGHWVSLYKGQENPLDLGTRRPKPPPPAKRRPPPAVALPPLPPVPEQDVLPVPEQSPVPEDVGGGTPSGSGQPVMDDAAPPPQRLLPWPPKAAPLGDLGRPENGFRPRAELIGANRAVHPVAGQGRDFWDRGGTGLVLGAGATVLGAVIIFSNPVGWAMGLTGAMMFASGVAASLSSRVELASSYAGTTTPEQDAAMNRATSAVLAIGSPAGLLGGVAGTVYSGDAEGFEQGALWGGLAEFGYGLGVGLPRVLRAVPGLWQAAAPWMKSLLMAPAFSIVSVDLGGGFIGGRRLMKAGRAVKMVKGGVAARSRLGQIRSVEVLEKELVRQDADWARFQVYATRSNYEQVVRVTYKNGLVRIVRLDAFDAVEQAIAEAKHGDMGQMFNREKEAFIIDQAQIRLDIADFQGWQGGIWYPVSTETGAERLIQRFNLEFPGPVNSGRLQVYWEPWPPE